MGAVYLDENKPYTERVAHVARHNPQMTPEQAERYLGALVLRRDKKDELLARGYSNRLAEKTLDRLQIPRPWGWRTVFFYPDSNTPRFRYVALAIAMLAYFIWRGSNG